MSEVLLILILLLLAFVFHFQSFLLLIHLNPLISNLSNPIITLTISFTILLLPNIFLSIFLNMNNLYVSLKVTLSFPPTLLIFKPKLNFHFLIFFIASSFLEFHFPCISSIFPILYFQCRNFIYFNFNETISKVS